LKWVHRHDDDDVWKDSKKSDDENILDNIQTWNMIGFWLLTIGKVEIKSNFFHLLIVKYDELSNSQPALSWLMNDKSHERNQY
jgi:hypothetical protein